MIFDHFLSFEDVDIALQHTNINIGDSPLSSSSYRHSSDRKSDYNSSNIENSIKNNNVNSNIINNNFIKNNGYLGIGDREREKERVRRERGGERGEEEEDRIVTELDDNDDSVRMCAERTDGYISSQDKKRRNGSKSIKDKQRDRHRTSAPTSSSSSSSSYSSSSSSSSQVRNADRYESRTFLNSTPSSPPSSSSSTSSQARTVECNPFPVLGMASPILAPYSNFDSPNASIHHLDDFNESCNDVTTGSTMFVRGGSVGQEMMRRVSLLSPSGVLSTAMKRKHGDMSIASTTLPNCRDMESRIRFDDDVEDSSVRVNRGSAGYETSMLVEGEDGVAQHRSDVHNNNMNNTHMNNSNNNSMSRGRRMRSASVCVDTASMAVQGWRAGHGGSGKEREMEEEEEGLFGAFSVSTSRFMSRGPRTGSIRYRTALTIRYHIILHCTVPYCSLSFCTALCCSVRYHSVLYCTSLFRQSFF